MSDVLRMINGLQQWWIMSIYHSVCQKKTVIGMILHSPSSTLLLAVDVLLPEDGKVLLWSALYYLKNIGGPPWNPLHAPTCKSVLKGTKVACRLIICCQLPAPVWPECVYVCVAPASLLSGYQFFFPLFKMPVMTVLCVLPDLRTCQCE